MSGLPSPLKSPALTPSQVTDGFHVAHSWLVNVPPLDRATYHWPRESARPAMSMRPSPLKSAAMTSTHVTPLLHVVQSAVKKLLAPVFSPTYHWPKLSARPAMSVLPSPLKSPVRTSAQVTAVLQVAQVDRKSVV